MVIFYNDKLIIITYINNIIINHLQPNPVCKYLSHDLYKVYDEKKDFRSDSLYTVNSLNQFIE